MSSGDRRRKVFDTAKLGHVLTIGCGIRGVCVPTFLPRLPAHLLLDCGIRGVLGPPSSGLKQL